MSEEVREDENHPWNKHFDRVLFAEKLLIQCKGKSECAPEFDLRDVTDGNILQDSGLVLFAQVSCKQAEDMLLWKNLVGMAAACFGLLMVAHFQASISRLKGQFRIDKAIMPLVQNSVEHYSA